MVVWATGAAASAPADSAYVGPRRALIEVGLPRRVPAALDSIPHPWPGRALILSTLGSVVPLLVASAVGENEHDLRTEAALTAVVAEVFTPSAGHLYAGQGRRALYGMAGRAVGAGMILAGVAAHEGSSEFDGGVAGILFGGCIMVLGASIDVVAVATDVERANRELARARGSVRVRPAHGGAPAMLVVGLRF
jgi:hypothetical protein